MPCFQRVFSLISSEVMLLPFTTAWLRAQQEIANVLVGVRSRLRQIEMPAVARTLASSCRSSSGKLAMIFFDLRPGL